MTKKARRAEIRIQAMDYLSAYVLAVLDCDPGPHPIATTDEEHDYLERFIKDESLKLRERAVRARAKL